MQQHLHFRSGLRESSSHVLNTTVLAETALLTNFWQAPVKVPSSGGATGIFTQCHFH